MFIHLIKVSDFIEQKPRWCSGNTSACWLAEIDTPPAEEVIDRSPSLKRRIKPKPGARFLVEASICFCIF